MIHFSILEFLKSILIKSFLDKVGGKFVIKSSGVRECYTSLIQYLFANKSNNNMR